jgi:hypothetical protein
VGSVRQYSIQPTTVADEERAGRLPADLMETIASLPPQSYRLYRIVPRRTAQPAIALCIPTQHRIGIAWEGGVDWAESTGNIERDVSDWVRSRGAWHRE